MKRLLVIISIALVGAALVLTTGTTNAADQSVSVQDNVFVPASVTVNVGDTVTWTWAGSNPHTVTANAGAFNSGASKTTGTFAQTFSTAGTYAYHCEVHGQAMSGTVVVTAAAGQPTAAAGQPTAVAGAPTAAATTAAAAASPTAGAVVAPATGTGAAGGGGSVGLLVGSIAAASGVLILAGGMAAKAQAARRRRDS